MRRAPVVFALLVLAACDSNAPPTAPDGAPDPSAIVIDGTSDGNSHLFFLPPVVENPNALFTAPADASLFPRVEICEWDVPDDSCVDQGVEFTYTTTTGPGGTVVQVFSDHYQVDWDTQLPGVDVGKIFRARILLVGLELGSVDLQLADNGKEVKNLVENEVIGLVDNRTLPLNFRIEEGAVEEAEADAEDTSEGGACEGAIDCDVEIIDASEGGTATVVNDPGGVDETLAASVLIQENDAVDANGDPVSDFQITLQHVADAPSEDLSPDNQIPFFIDLTAVDGNGDPVFFQSGAVLTVCNPPDLGDSEAEFFVPNELHHSLRIFRVTGAGVTEILPTGIDGAELCGGGIHGGLNTVLTTFSGFGTVLPTVPSLSTAVVPDGLVGAPTVIDIQAMVESNEHANELEPDLCLDDGTACEQIFGGDEVVVTITGANSATLTVDNEGIADNADTEDEEPGTYTATYTPENAGTDNVKIEIRNIVTGELEEISGSPFTSVVSFGASLAGYEVVSTEVLLAASGFHRTSVLCPSGKVVLGGGARVIGEGNADFNTRIQESAPGTIGGGANDVWVVAISNQDAVDHTIQFSAICATPPSGYEVVNGADTGILAGGWLGTSVLCPSGKAVLGGGVKVVGEGSADFNTRVHESSPGTIGGGANDVWAVAISNEDAVTHTVSVSAICATPPTGYEVVTNADVNLASGSFHRAAILCPSGTNVLSGGAQVVGEGSADFDTRLQESGPGTVSGQDNWLVSFKNLDTSAHTVRVFSVCAG